MLLFNAQMMVGITKRYLKLRPIALALVVSMASMSCNKQLDMAPDGFFSLEEVFNDNLKVAAFLNSCYEQIPAKGSRYYFWSRGPVVWSDEAWDGDAEAEPNLISGRLYNGDASAANH